MYGLAHVTRREPYDPIGLANVSRVRPVLSMYRSRTTCRNGRYRMYMIFMIYWYTIFIIYMIYMIYI